ncbi:hypothetical protein HP550_12965 [Cellulomonas humilata]|uniref:Uncharacterized protein n=1 Tax=Cellulomonas humilata TaxID=144055 RepID=A0A7Y6DY77_9CELL|nr:hypothetical protein [Cellulomonas humilata]NUU18160.1 hypothetical protein [Cellulomonas humilata]
MTPTRALRRRAPRSDDRGAGTLEYIGVVAVVAALVGALVLGFANSHYGENLSAQLCKITSAVDGGSCPVPPTERAPEDYVPPDACVVSSNGEESSTGLTVVVDVQGGETWLIEKLGDGTYRLTRARSGGVGIGVGVGFDFSATVDSQTYGLGATAKANVALVGGGGESYIATSEEHARNILDQKRNDETKDSLVGDDNPVRDGVDWLNDQLGGSNTYEQLDPDEWFVEAGIEGEASAGASTPLGTVGAEAAIEAYLGRTDRADGTSTDYLRAEMSIGGGMEGRGPNAQGYDTFINYTAEGSAGAVIEVDRDKDGNPVTFRIKSVLMGNATGDSSYSGPVEDDPEYTERTIDIPLDSATGRQTAARVLQAAGVPYYPGITDTVDIPQIAQDKLDPTALGRELGALAAARGHISEQTYTLGTSEDGFNAEGDLGVQLGLSHSSITSSRSTSDYRYWDGTEMTDRAGCTA